MVKKHKKTTPEKVEKRRKLSPCIQKSDLYDFWKNRKTKKERDFVIFICYYLLFKPNKRTTTVTVTLGGRGDGRGSANSQKNVTKRYTGSMEVMTNDMAIGT